MFLNILGLWNLTINTQDITSIQNRVLEHNFKNFQIFKVFVYLTAEVSQGKLDRYFWIWGVPIWGPRTLLKKSESQILNRYFTNSMFNYFIKASICKLKKRIVHNETWINWWKYNKWISWLQMSEWLEVE